MANQSTEGFGLRPLRMVGQRDNTGSLGEWKKAVSTTQIFHQDLVLLAGTGYVVVRTAGIAVVNALGSLNGSFYTDPTSSKPTWSNFAPNNAATDMTCLISDDPKQMFEMRTTSTSLTQADAGGTAPIVATAPTGSKKTSGYTIGAVVTAINQLKLIGITRDEQNQTLDESGSIWRVMLCSHILGSNIAGI